MTEKEKLQSLISTGNIYSSTELTAAGISRMAIRRFMDSGDMLQYTRGIYMSPNALGENGLDLAVLSKLRKGVVCLLSAASYHEVGDVNPTAIWYAVDREKVKNPSLASFQAAQTIFWSGDMLERGVDKHRLFGQDVRITSPARTVVDLFRFRNKIGEETALRTFGDFLKTGGDMAEVWSIAQHFQVDATLAPFFQLGNELQESLPQRTPQ